MDLVVNNQPPIVTVEEREMRVFVFCWHFSICLLFTAGTTVRENLVGAHCNGADFFAISRVLAYHLRWNIRLVQEFLYPLSHCYGIGGEDQRSALDIGYRGQADDRFASTTGQHDDAAASTGCASRIECSRGPILVCAWLKLLPRCCDRPQLHGYRGTIGIPG